MIYRQRNKKKINGTKVIIGLFISFLILRIFNVTFFGDFFTNTTNTILESKMTIFSPLKNSLLYFKSKKELSLENEKIKNENFDLKLSSLTQQATEAEFNEFKKLYANISTSTSTVKVLLKPPFMPFDTIRIAGNINTYEIGNLVFFQNVVIGTLVENTNSFGTVELFSTPGKKTPAIIKGTQFEANGLGGGRYEMEVPKDFEVQVGDTILYPHEKIILLGVVEQSEVREDDLFKKIYFNTPVPLDSLSYVTIGIKSHEEIENI